MHSLYREMLLVGTSSFMYYYKKKQSKKIFYVSARSLSKRKKENLGLLTIQVYVKVLSIE